ncbi:MAG TPA: hypothetical protein DD827_01465 [Gammaproteobacteria bacterium]|jgi:hypothetical protein|nr:hypothetical protein [Gammaproteobacteria bacterium]
MAKKFDTSYITLSELIPSKKDHYLRRANTIFIRLKRRTAYIRTTEEKFNAMQPAYGITIPKIEVRSPLIPNN